MASSLARSFTKFVQRTAGMENYGSVAVAVGTGTAVVSAYQLRNDPDIRETAVGSAVTGIFAGILWPVAALAVTATAATYIPLAAYQRATRRSEV